MTERPVVDIGIEPRRLTAPQRAYRALADLGVDPAKLEARVKAAKPDHFVPAITLRREQFAKDEDALRAIAGLVFRDETRTLAPTPTFGRAVLGSVREATAETLAKAGPLAAATDYLGASGLQLAFQDELAGRPSGEVRLLNRATSEVVEVLHTFDGVEGTPLRTTLDRRPSGRGRAGTRRRDEAGRAGRRTAEHRRGARRRQRTGRQRVRPGAGRAVPARLHVQGRLRLRAVPRRSPAERCRRVPAVGDRRRQAVQELRRPRRSRARPVLARLRDVVQHRVHQRDPSGSTRTRSARRRRCSGSAPSGISASVRSAVRCRQPRATSTRPRRRSDRARC